MFRELEGAEGVPVTDWGQWASLPEDMGSAKAGAMERASPIG